MADRYELTITSTQRMVIRVARIMQLLSERCSPSGHWIEVVHDRRMVIESDLNTVLYF